jgi:hypothetical protein
MKYNEYVYNLFGKLLFFVHFLTIRRVTPISYKTRQHSSEILISTMSAGDHILNLTVFHKLFPSFIVHSGTASHADTAVCT